MSLRFKNVSINYPMAECPQCDGSGFGPYDPRGCSPLCGACGGNGCIPVMTAEVSKDPAKVPNRLIRDIIMGEVQARENEARP
jgi:hypothetical protein